MMMVYSSFVTTPDIAFALFIIRTGMKEKYAQSTKTASAHQHHQAQHRKLQQCKEEKIERQESLWRVPRPGALDLMSGLQR